MMGAMQPAAALRLAGISVSVIAASGMVDALAGGSISGRSGPRPLLPTFLIAAPILSFALLEARNWALLPVLILLGLAIPPSQVEPLSPEPCHTQGYDPTG